MKNFWLEIKQNLIFTMVNIKIFVWCNYKWLSLPFIYFYLMLLYNENYFSNVEKPFHLKKHIISSMTCTILSAGVKKKAHNLSKWCVLEAWFNSKLRSIRNHHFALPNQHNTEELGWVGTATARWLQVGMGRRSGIKTEIQG